MSTVTSSFTLNQAFVNTNAWPVTLIGIASITITVSGTITFTSANNYFIIGSNNVVIEGANNVIDVSGVTNYHGLALNVSTLSYNLTIRNLGITTSGGSTLTNAYTYNAGWFVSGENYANGSHADVSNCYSTGVIIQIGGGIFGQNCQGTATNCYSTGSIGGSSGGIFGADCSGNTTNCYSTGGIGASAGGIFGANSRGTATNCYSTGSISGLKAGGIFGPYDSSANNTSSATKCFSTGNITGTQAGGIFAYINGHVGEFPSHIINISATNCFSTGLISSVNGGGIVGTAVDGGTYTATNCYSTGNGLPGDYGNGQIFGITGSNANIYAINCYGAGTSPNGICGNNYSGNPLTITNCYNANGSWSDTTANANLTGTGGSLGVIGTTWTSVLSANTPYKLTAFNASQYNPTSASILIGASYISSSGSALFNNFYKIYNSGSATVAINSSIGTLTYSNTVNTGINRVNVYATAPSGYYSLSQFNLTITDRPCFKEGTKILCMNEFEQTVYMPIQNIRPGMLVKTINHGFVPVNMIGTSKLYNSGSSERTKEKLYKCAKSQYSELFEDLYITGNHAILVKDITDKQRKASLEMFGQIYVTDRHYRLMACIDDRTTPYEKEGTFNIYHLALDNDDYYMNYGIYANGLLVETCSKRYMNEYSGMKLLR